MLQSSLLLGGDFAGAGAVAQDSFGCPAGCVEPAGRPLESAPVLVGAPRTLAAAAKIVEALGLAIDLTEVGPKS